MCGDASGPVLGQGLAAGGFRIGNDGRVWLAAGGSEDEKLSDVVTKGTEGQRRHQHRAVRAGRDGSDAEFDFSAAGLKLPVMVAKNFCALQLDPESTVSVGHKALDGTDGDGSWSGLLEKTKIQAVEADQALFGADPEIAVSALGDGGNYAAGKATLAAPAVADVFGFDFA